jgi:hypothetical protein
METTSPWWRTFAFQLLPWRHTQQRISPLISVYASPVALGCQWGEGISASTNRARQDSTQRQLAAESVAEQCWK